MGTTCKPVVGGWQSDLLRFMTSLSVESSARLTTDLSQLPFAIIHFMCNGATVGFFQSLSVIIAQRLDVLLFHFFFSMSLGA